MSGTTGVTWLKHRAAGGTGNSPPCGLGQVPQGRARAAGHQLLGTSATGGAGAAGGTGNGPACGSGAGDVSACVGAGLLGGLGAVAVTVTWVVTRGDPEATPGRRGVGWRSLRSWRNSGGEPSWRARGRLVGG